MSRLLLIVAALALACGCSATKAPAELLTMTLDSPARMTIAASTPNAFVDRTYEPWFFVSSPGLGDNPADQSAVRLSLTVSSHHADIDNYASAALLFRAPGVRECASFSGTVDYDEHPGGWTIAVDAFCLEGEGYVVHGTITGAEVSP